MNIEGDRTTHYIDLTFFMAKSALSEMGLGSDAVAQPAHHILIIFTHKNVSYTPINPSIQRRHILTPRHNPGQAHRSG